MAMHAAREYGVDVVGVTLSKSRPRYARKRVADEGLTDRVEIRVQDYRDVDDGPFDAISLHRHGRTRRPRAVRRDYVAELHGLLRPGGRLLNHPISWTPGPTSPDPDEFIDRYVFPDGEMLSLADRSARWSRRASRCATSRRCASTTRSRCAPGCTTWSSTGTRPCAATSPGRARVWRLYMAACALGFEDGLIGVNQVLVQRPGGTEPPLRRTEWI